MDILKTIALSRWDSDINNEISRTAIHALEHGQIVFLPQLAFTVADDEKDLLSPHVVNPKRKNISFDCHTNSTHGDVCTPLQHRQLNAFMRRYYQHALALVSALFPGYQKQLISGRTSLRTIEIAGRKSSYKKDDTRLHVDSFSATPVNGLRILRVFTNINPHGVARIWQTGEPFATVAKRFIPEIPSMSALERHLIRAFKITKTLRSSYDHFMLNIHNKMKKDMDYQNSIIKTTIQLPPASSWIVYTDQVSHAALSGQHVLEQSFYLPRSAMYYPETAPLSVLEEILKHSLVIGNKTLAPIAATEY